MSSRLLDARIPNKSYVISDVKKHGSLHVRLGYSGLCTAQLLHYAYSNRAKAPAGA